MQRHGAGGTAWPSPTGSTLRFCGETDANVFATTWCKTMQYYYDLYVESSMEVYVYTDRDFLGRSEPQDFTALVSRASGRKLHRAESLRQLKPTTYVTLKGFPGPRHDGWGLSCLFLTESLNSLCAALSLSPPELRVKRCPPLNPRPPELQ